MSSPADAAARRQAAVAAAASLEPLAGYPAAIVADGVLDHLRATFASQAQSAYQQSSALMAARAAAQFAISTAAAVGASAGLLGAVPGGGVNDFLHALPVAQGLLPAGFVVPPTGLDGGGMRRLGQFPGEVERKMPAEEAAYRARQAKEEKARKEALALEAEKLRCHLHKKSKDGCKFCKRHQEFVVKDNEAKAAAKEKFMSAVASKKGSQRLESAGPLELINTKNYGFPPMLQTHIVESTHFKTLLDFQTIEDILHEISGFVDSVEPYVQNSTTTPSALLCCAYRLLTMNLTAGQLRRVVENEENPYIRCAGFLFIRFGLSPDQLWSWLGEYVLDDEELKLNGKDESAGTTTIGHYVESLLTHERYFCTVLPRLPTPIKRQLEAKLAQVPQDRRRTKANRRLLEVYSQRGTKIEARVGDGDWRQGETLEVVDEHTSRPKLRVRLLDRDGDDDTVVNLGRVILADSRFHSRPARRRSSRSRSGGNLDWSREKGKSTAELLEEHRRREQDKAVCATGKEYAKRPVSFQVALPMEQGSASKGLHQKDRSQDETYVSSGEARGSASHIGRRGGGDHDRGRSRSPRRRREENVEHQARMKQLFEKYGQSGAPNQEDRRRNDIEGPEVLRLG